MKGTWILIWRGHIFQRDNLVSAETRIFKKFFQRLCQNLKLLGSFIPNGFHVSQYPQQPGQMKQRIQHLLRGSVPSSTLEICSRASSWPSEPRVQCENAGISLCICFGLLWETVMSKLPGSEQDSCCKLFAKAPLPSVGARFFPPQTVCTRTKNKNYCQINSSSPKTMAGGKILGHWVPAKTCHFPPPLWERLWEPVVSQSEGVAAESNCCLSILSGTERISQFLERGKRFLLCYPLPDSPLGLGMEN